jgi:hypothetical protein
MKTKEDIYKVLDSIEPDENGCHHYPSRNTTGYYRHITVDGIYILVHRFALERKLGRPIKPELQALHTCDHKSCVNPEHLYEGTYTDNIHDILTRNPEAWKRGRDKSALLRWQDPTYRQNRARLINERMKDPEYRKRIDAIYEKKRKPKKPPNEP